VVTAPVAALGRGLARRLARMGALARFFAHTLLGWSTLPREGRRVVSRVLVNQVWFTALQAVPIIIFLASILSYLVISQAVRELGRINATELLGTLMVVAIVRELGPLLTALVVTGRSGTAIATELGTNTVMGEVHALEGMGIDPVHYLVLPRFGAAIISVFGLVLLFDLVAIVAGLIAASANGMSSARYFDIVLQSLTTHDIWLTVAKGTVFGAVIGTVPSYHGLSVRGGPTGVPVASSQAVVGSILLIFVWSALFVLVLQ
jgi:phospholipid/cholesterol/gamma-HCH transport system permease protein